MSSRIAEFPAYASLERDEQTLLATDDARVRMTREVLTLSDGDTSHSLPIDSVVAFDFQTVPEEWEGFFDDLVGVRFRTEEGVVTATIGTDTDTIDRFTTVLLKLLVDGTAVSVRQYDADGSGDDARTVEDATMTLYPGRHCIAFEDADRLEPIDVATVTGVTQATDTDGSPALLVRHLSTGGRTRTAIRTHKEGRLDFLRSYLEVRVALSKTAGPVSMLFVGPSRETFVAVARRLDERNVDVDVAHAADVQEAIACLDANPVEVVATLYHYEDGDATDLATAVAERDAGTPVVVMGTDLASEGPDDLAERPEVFATVTLDASEDTVVELVDVLERAAVSARIE